MDKGFTNRTLATPLPGYFRWDVILNPVGYYIESDAILQAVARLYDYCKALEPGSPLPLHFDVDPDIRLLKTRSLFITDYGSIPRLLWSIFDPREIRRPAMGHDGLYRALWWLWDHDYIGRDLFAYYRRAADDLFLESMGYTDPLVAQWKKWAAHKAVRSFGGVPWAAGKPPPRIENPGEFQLDKFFDMGLVQK